MQTVESFAAREYSRKISERVGSAWRAKKRNTPDGTAVTSLMPAWLEGRAGEPIRVNEERAAIVREIFQLAASGLGKRMIARVLNERGIPPFRGKSWGHSYIGKLLHSRAPLGEWQPRKNDGNPDGDPRLNHFPQIVDAEREIASITLKLERAEQRAQRAIDALLEMSSPMLKDRLTKLETEIEEDKAARQSAIELV